MPEFKELTDFLSDYEKTDIMKVVYAFREGKISGEDMAGWIGISTLEETYELEEHLAEEEKLGFVTDYMIKNQSTFPDV